MAPSLRKIAAINYWGNISIRTVADGRELAKIDPILDRGQRSAFRPDVFAMAFSPAGGRGGVSDPGRIIG